MPPKSKATDLESRAQRVLRYISRTKRPPLFETVKQAPQLSGLIEGSDEASRKASTQSIILTAIKNLLEGVEPELDRESREDYIVLRITRELTRMDQAMATGFTARTTSGDTQRQL
jgi:hypothetical protein